MHNITSYSTWYLVLIIYTYSIVYSKMMVSLLRNDCNVFYQYVWLSTHTNRTQVDATLLIQSACSVHVYHCISTHRLRSSTVCCALKPLCFRHIGSTWQQLWQLSVSCPTWSGIVLTIIDILISQHPHITSFARAVPGSETVIQLNQHLPHPLPGPRRHICHGRLEDY